MKSTTISHVFYMVLYTVFSALLVGSGLVAIEENPAVGTMMVVIGAIVLGVTLRWNDEFVAWQQRVFELKKEKEDEDQSGRGE